MKFHGIKMIGKFYHQMITSLPTWTSNDEGREIYVNGTRWYGTSSKWQRYGSSGASFDITQTSHGFSVLDVIYFDGSDWLKAKSDNVDTLATHVVVEVDSANSFVAAQSGRFEITSHGLISGNYYYTSETVAGDIVVTEPSTYSNPIILAENANFIHVLPFRPSKIDDNCIETVPTLPTWTSSDEGKVIYVDDEDSLYYGTSTSWVKIDSNNINITPEKFNYDDIDLGVDGGVAFGMIDTADFDNAEDGSIWFSVNFPSTWILTSDVRIELKYLLNGTDNGKNVKLIIQTWVVDDGDTPNISSPTTNTIDNITSSSINTNKLHKTLLTSVIGNSNITSNTEMLTFKITREASNVADTYGGTLQLASIKIYQ